MESVTHNCLCGETAAAPTSRHGLPMLMCNCGVLRQDVRLTEEELADWYASDYIGGDGYKHTYEHDRDVAHKRLDAYKITMGSRVFDVGAGNGAFVDAASARGYEAQGQDLACQKHPRIFEGDLAGVAIPAHSYDVVTMHDVLEHVPDPKAMLKEVARILRPGGRFILDWPRFHHESGEHHWKPTEHLWMLTDCQVKELLEEAGLELEKKDHPVDSKSVFYCINRKTPDNVRIVVPPGIGDGWWVASKLRGILEREEVYLPEVFVHGSGPRRADRYWERVPFVRFGGYAELKKSSEWNIAYKPPGQPIQRNVQGYDFFISFNGTMDAGVSLDEADPAPTRWFEPWHIPLEHYKRVTSYMDRYGDYIVVSFWDRGFYEKWLKDFNYMSIRRTLVGLANEGYTIVFMGAPWDKDKLSSQVANTDPRFVDLIGRTSFDDMVALVDGASAIFGHPAGNTMMGTFFRRPTVLLWGNTFPESFRRNACPPNIDYVPLDVRGLAPKTAINTVKKVAAS